MWLLRGGILLVALGLRIAKFHVPSVFVNNCFTLNAFAIPACLWLGFEIIYYQNRNPVALFEWCGKWSYSLYIMHPLAPAILIAVSGLSTFESAGAKTILLLLVFIVSLIFYFLVEYPGHRFAVYVSKMLKPVPVVLEPVS
jgi:peptidoglycan/LPS O-acetylase OafA/YrhL